MRIARITISDRASAGVYADLSGPEIESALAEHFPDAQFEAQIVPDEVPVIGNALKRSVEEKFPLIITTGGTGITPRDVTPEATRSVLEKELPGFGEAMRMGSFSRVRTSILSRATAGIRGGSLIVNLPGKPRAVRECLEILAPAIKEALSHLAGEDPHVAASTHPSHG
jgi:molybdopterin adenylyltransferase